MSTTTRKPAPPAADGDSPSYFFISYDIDDYCESQSYGTLAVFTMAVTLIGFLASIFLILIIFKNQRLRGDKYLLLNNLVGSCVFLLFLSGFLYIEDALNPCWDAGIFICKTIHFVKTVLTNASTFFLIALAFEQLNRYRECFVTIFNSTHIRCIIVSITLWCIAILISLPEIVFARILFYTSKVSMCGVYHTHMRQRFSLTIKILFFEYITPFIILAVVMVITGIYVAVIKSRFSTWGTTTGTLNPRDINHPRHFSLVATLTVVFILGYFPKYSYELASMLEAISADNYFSLFWWHMNTVATFFVVLPPALTPLITILLSWQHRNVFMWIYGHFTVNYFEQQQEENRETITNVENGAEENTPKE